MIRFPPCCFMVSFRISMYFSNSCKSWRSRNAKNLSNQHCTTLFVDLWISKLDKPYMDGKRTERRTTRRSDHLQKGTHALPRAATSGCAWASRAGNPRAREGAWDTLLGWFRRPFDRLSMAVLPLEFRDEMTSNACVAEAKARVPLCVS